MRFSELKKLFTTVATGVTTLANGTKLYHVSTAITPGTTAAVYTAGSLGITSHATGRGKLYQSDGAVWRLAGIPATYRAVVAQAGTAAPTATIHENTLGGTVVLARSSAGVYTFTLATVFTASKTFISATVDAGATAVIARVAHTSADVVTITTATEAGVAADLVGNLNLQIIVAP